jgi:DNA helicase-2/ATP-dependent DNA helicase PcrA
MAEIIFRSPAEIAADNSRQNIIDCINNKKNFLVEAGAGAGKTYSLRETLNYLIQNQGPQLLKRHQQIVCVTYTNVASEEISSRIDKHPAVRSSTIHSFLWQVIKDFQSFIRTYICSNEKWQDIIEGCSVTIQRIYYNELGRRKITESEIWLAHDDILFITCELLAKGKFRRLLTSRFPILLIDEYQDTNTEIVESIKKNFLDIHEGPLMGFFGDHWQKIFPKVCGKIEHPTLTIIPKESNFRSAPVIVDCLNRMRPQLKQEVSNPDAIGEVRIYHTNEWTGGQRRVGGHWKGDLPPVFAHKYLSTLKEQLYSSGWAKEDTKILMLTHNVLAQEQGYKNLADVFEFKDSLIKKQDPHIAFLVDTIEPASIAYENKRFGDMLSAFGGITPAIHSREEKQKWILFMDKLLLLRDQGTVGDLIDHVIENSEFIAIPSKVEELENKLKTHLISEQQIQPGNEKELEKLERLNKLRQVSYLEIKALDKFIDGHTPFSTKHGVKGAQFENVLIVFGRGWADYDFNQFLEWAKNPDQIPPDKIPTFERNRNLFYVTCSRPMKRLALLFTQRLSPSALDTLKNWFGSGTIQALPNISEQNL